MAINNGTSWPRNGFTPVRRDNTLEQYVRRYPASALTNIPIAIGQAVTIVQGVVVPATAGDAATLPGFGVVVGVFNSSGRPFTQFATKYIASATNGLVDVLYDPNAEYVVRCETSVGPSNINTNVVLTTASAPALSLPRIAQSVDITASATNSTLFRIVRLAEQNDLLALGSNPVGGSGNAVIVRWNSHVYKAGTAGQ